MHSEFLKLPKDKQQKIVNAALEVFSKYEYSKANTAEIAHLAGIAKGSLFYYFKNKEALYLYVYQYVTSLTQEILKEDTFLEITDFFELLHYTAKKKVQIVEANPHLLNFILQCYHSQNEAISNSVQHDIVAIIQKAFTKYFINIDFSKFRDDVNPKEVYQLMAWTSEGYLHEKKKLQQPIDIDSLMEEFYRWEDLFKKMAYKEEYQ